MQPTRPTLIPFLLILFPLAACSEVPDPASDDVGKRTAPVIGGHPTPQGQFPAIGTLMNADSAFCTGTLIKPDVVLTAAHCLVDFPAGEIRFSLTNDTVNTTPVTVAVKRTVVHQQFDIQHQPDVVPARSFDIGLVFLTQPITGVTPVALPTTAEVTTLAPGAPITLVGYGIIMEDGLQAGVKYDAMTDLVTLGEFELQLSSTGRPQNCYGDSGGPALATLGGGERVVGIVSHGASHDTGCSHGGIDTRVDAYLDWIAQQLASPGTPDAGVPPVDAGVPPADAAAPHPDAGAPAQGDGGGCSCQVGQRGAAATPGTLALLAALLLTFRTAGRRARRRGSRTPA